MASEPNAKPHPMRETHFPVGARSPSMQRLQIGLSGLAAMLLLVGLANIIMDRAQQSDAEAVPEAAPTVAPSVAAEAASDPLADAGVVPAMPDTPSPTPTAPPAQAGRNAAQPPAPRP